MNNLNTSFEILEKQDFIDAKDNLNCNIKDDYCNIYNKDKKSINYNNNLNSKSIINSTMQFFNKLVVLGPKSKNTSKTNVHKKQSLIKNIPCKFDLNKINIHTTNTRSLQTNANDITYDIINIEYDNASNISNDINNNDIKLTNNINNLCKQININSNYNNKNTFDEICNESNNINTNNNYSEFKISFIENNVNKCSNSNIKNKLCNDDDKMKPYNLIEWRNIFKNKTRINFTSKRLQYSLRYGFDSSEIEKDKLRPYVWFNLSSADILKSNYPPGFYKKACNNKSKNKTEKELLVENSILKDIERTYFDNKELSCNNSNTDELFRVLKAYSILDEEVGYCQGINFLALRLLNVIKDEELSFWVLVSLMKDKDWRNNYINGLPKLEKDIKELQCIIKNSLPKLYNHFQNESLVYIGVFSSYFTTLFSYNVCNSYSIRIWDMFFVFNKKIIIEALLKILRLCQNELLLLDQDVRINI